MKYDVIGIGNALVDIEVQLGDEELAGLGYPKGGMTLSSDEDQQKLLEKLKKHSFSTCSGGSAANTIHGMGALGGKAYYVGRVANDDYGKHYTQDMADCGVGFSGPGAENDGTGTSVVLITPDAQRTMVTHLGISTALHTDNVDETIVEGAKFVYIEGYLWSGDETRAAGIALARAAKKRGIPVAFSLSDTFIVNGFREAVEDFIKWDVDILFCNEVEGLSLAGEKDPATAFDKILGICETLFLTRGENGAWAARRGEEKVSVKGYKVRAVDTTGAGDLFAAGALTGLLHKKGLKECTILGCYAASQVVSHLGARMPAHCHKNINGVIEEYSE
ncbi:MAG: adenosine kinase [Deltaproteobacteria bacterium]|nr:adenosine kinase [Deltaproteobacteria bacterium]